MNSTTVSDHYQQNFSRPLFSNYKYARQLVLEGNKMKQITVKIAAGKYKPTSGKHYRHIQGGSSFETVLTGSKKLLVRRLSLKISK